MLSHRTGEDDADRPPYGGAGADDEGVSVASSLTLDQVEQPWPPPPDSATDLVRRCHRLRRVPVGELTTEGLRVLLGQQIGVPTLLPLAVARLVEDPLTAGDYYPGDLLRAVLRLPDQAWTDPDLTARLARVLDQATLPAPEPAGQAQAWLERRRSDHPA
ncbi:MAG: contact-dependent growth inhibition system immunity protein [Actinomycetia bacterium]|nr:contact-dependent growth inhibition system immunity protein [Actinomycetes bacterium]